MRHLIENNLIEAIKYMRAQYTLHKFHPKLAINSYPYIITSVFLEDTTGVTFDKRDITL